MRDPGQLAIASGLQRPMGSLWAILLVLVASVNAISSDGGQYILVSQPRLSSVVYLKYDMFSNSAESQPQPLVTDGLTTPFGIAFDKKRQYLYIADGGMAKVFMYKLIMNGDKLVTDGTQYVAISNIQPRWVAVDDEGTVYATDESQSLVAKVSLAQVEASAAGSEVMYSGSSVNAVSKPGGIAADGRFVFWANKENGKGAGVVVRADEAVNKDDPTGSVTPLANNIDTAFGVCASQNNVFFTADKQRVYGVKKTATIDTPSAAEITDILVTPRGCAWDGDGTVYVADKGGNSIWGFPCQMQTLVSGEIAKLFTLEDPFGVAVYAPTPQKPYDAASQSQIFGFLTSWSKANTDKEPTSKDKPPEKNGGAVRATTLAILMATLVAVSTCP